MILKILILPLIYHFVVGSIPMPIFRIPTNLFNRAIIHMYCNYKIRCDILPSQIFDAEKFLDLGALALSCRVKRTRENVKLKLRTKKRLYTYVTDPETAEALLQKLNCDVIEL